MGKQSPAEKRADLIDLLWKLKHGVQTREHLDFPSLLADPMYRRKALRRISAASPSRQIKTLIDQITDLDPGVDLNTDVTLSAFEHNRTQQNGVRTTQDHARYFIGGGLMLIAVTVFIGLIAIKLTADGFGKSHTALNQTQFYAAQHSLHGGAAPRRP